MSTNVKCNMCDSEDYKYYKNIAGHNNIVQCNQCGLIYSNPIPDFETWSRELQKVPVFSESKLKIDENKYEIFLNEIESLNRKSNRKILDVGCGFGQLLANAKKRSWQVYGVEITKFKTTYVSEKFGIDIFCGELKQAKYPNDYFDVITALEFLEHLIDPSDFLQEARRVIKKDGILAIVVPNVESSNAKTDPLWWQSYHFFHFNADSLTRILKKNDFEIIKMIVNPHLETRNSDQKLFFRKIIFDYLQWAVVFVRKILSTRIATKLMIKNKLIKTGGLTIYARKTA